MNVPSPQPAGSAPCVARKHALSRRSFLRGAGIVLSLPMLDAMVPALARAAGSSSPSPTDSGAKPRRMLAICNNLGLVPEYFFPQQSGRDYKPSPYLEHLAEQRPGAGQEHLTGLGEPAALRGAVEQAGT